MWHITNLRWMKEWSIAEIILVPYLFLDSFNLYHGNSRYCNLGYLNSTLDSLKADTKSWHGGVKENCNLFNSIYTIQRKIATNIQSDCEELNQWW